MGVQHYLVRRDNKTLYELGKAGDWRSAFGSGSPTIEQLKEASVYQYDDLYWIRLIVDIERWLEGQPVEFISEFVLEDLQEGYDRTTGTFVPVLYRVTGSRFSEQVRI